ncbi:MAG: TonB family protein [Pseudomonadota bacterium]|nr:energy transducer TonB [Gammaproteobacteria bacterium]MEC8011790.1 TonB family protein [Pseudomonadota bacterium]
MSEIQRFNLILVGSVLAHVALIFGVHWSTLDPAPPASTLEITLAQFKSETQPDQADFLAQANQQGSGTLEEKAELSTVEQAQFRANEINQVQQSQQVMQQQNQEVVNQKLITSVQDSWSENEQEDSKKLEEQSQGQDMSEDQQLSTEIASLEAELRNERQAYAKRPRRRQLTAVATKAAADAAYLHQWRQKIENVGNLNYPDLNIYGELTLLVAVRANGTIEKVEIRRSSGYRSLDEAAKRIVRQAAPFDPFPESIRKHTDILEIIRTWRFEKEGYLSSSVR